MTLPFTSTSRAQTDVFQATDANDKIDWNVADNWSLNKTPDDSSFTTPVAVQIGAVDPTTPGVFITNTSTIGSLTFNATLNSAANGGAQPILLRSTQQLIIDGPIVNNTNFNEVISTQGLVAGASATWNTGAGGLTIGNLILNTSNVVVTGAGGLTVTGSDLNFAINSATTFGSIKNITTSGITFNVTANSYNGTAGDFFQLATGTLSGISIATTGGPGPGLSYVTTLANKGILFVEPTAGGTIINSNVILPIDLDSEFNPNGANTTVTFNGTAGPAELLTDKSEDGNNTPFTTARNLIINASTTAVIAAKTGTVATYGGIVSDQGGTAGTVTIGDTANMGLGTVVFNGVNTYSGATSIAAGAILNLGNAAAVQNSTLSFTSANALTFATGIGSFTLGGLSGSGNELLADTGANAVTLQVGNNNANTTYAGVLSGTGGALTKVGTGTLILSTAQTYTGLTTVTGGTLKSGATNVIPAGGNLTTGAAGTFDLAGHSEALTALTNGGTVTSSAAGGVLTFGNGSSGAGSFTGTMGVAFSDTTASTLTGTFTNTGNVTLNANAAAAINIGTANNTGTVINSGTGAGTATINAVGANVTAVNQNSSTSPLVIATLTTNATATTLTSAGTSPLTVTNSVANTTGNLILKDNTTGSITLAGGANNIGTITNSGTGSGASIVNGAIGSAVTAVNESSATSALNLNGAGTYAALNITQGTVKVGNATAVGTGTVTIGSAGNAGTLDLAGQTETIKGLATAGTAANQTISSSMGTGIVNYTGATSSFAGLVQNGAGTVGVTVNGGTANLTLGGANTYTGATTVTAGTLKAGVASVANTSGAFGNNSAVTVGATGVLDLAGFATQIGSLTGSGSVTDSAAAATLSVGGDNSSPAAFTGTISDGTNALALTKIGSGTETLSHANTYTGLTAVSAGTLAIGATNAIKSGNALITAIGATFDIAGNTQTLGTVTNGGTVTSSTAGGNLTIGNGSTGTGTYTGTENVTFNQGASSAAFASNFTNTGDVTLAATGTGTLTTSGTIGNTGNLILNANTATGAVTVASANNTGTITNSGTAAGLATVTTVGTSVSAITQASNTSALVITTLGLNAAGTTLTDSGTQGLTVTNQVTGAANLILKANSSGSITLAGGANNAGTITNSGTTGTNTIAGVIGTNVTNVIENGASALVLSGANTYTGATTVTTGTLKAGVASVANTSGAFGNNSAVTVGGSGVLDIAGFATQIGSLAGSGSVTNSGAAATLTTGGDNSTPTAFTGTISDGTGALALTKIGTGTETLSHANTYTGLTTVTAGTLKEGATNAIKSGNALTTGAGGVFDVAGLTQTLGAVTNAGNLTSSAAGGNLTLGSGSSSSGTITGTMNVTVAAGNGTAIGIASVNNAGTVTNSGAGAGVTTITTVGTNVTGVTEGVGASALNVTTLGLNAAGTTLTNSGSQALTVANQVTGAANLVVNDNGSGGVTLTAGANNGGTITNSGTSTGTTTIGAIGGNVTSVTENSANSQLLLTGAGAYSGLNITQGTVKVGSATSVGTGAVTIAAAGTLDLNGTTETINTLTSTGNGTVTNNGAANAALNFTGATTSNFGGVIKDGSKTTGLTVNNAGAIVTLSGANTYTGATTISAGKVNVTGSTGTSAVALNGGLLNVSGTVGGTVAIASGAVLTNTGTAGSVSAANLATGGAVNLTKDAAIGTLHIGNLTTTGGALDFEIGTGGLTQADKITTGSLTIGAGTVINLSNLANMSQTLTTGLYTLLSYSGSASGLGNFTLSSNMLDNDTLTLVTSNNGLVQVDVEAPVSLTTYTLGSSATSTRVATTGSTTVTSTITNTGSADTLTYTGLNATVAAGTNANPGTLTNVTLPMSTGAGTPLPANGGTASGTATYTAPATPGSVVVTPTVTSAKNTSDNTNSTLTSTTPTTINVVANRTETATTVALGRVIVNQTTGNQTTTVASATGQDSTLTRTTLATGTQTLAVTNGTVRVITTTPYTFGGANDAVNSTTANVNGTFTTAGNKSGNATVTVQGEGLSGEAVNTVSLGYTADAVNNRTETATGVNLGRVIVGQTTGSQSTTVNSATGQDSTLTRTTLAAGAQNATVTNGTVTLTNGTSYTFGGANDAVNSTTAGITGSFTTAGVQTGNASYTLTGEGLTGESVNPLSVAYTADAVNNRTESATTVNLGRVIVGQSTASQNTTVTSVTGQDTTLTRTTLGTATQNATVTNGTLTLTKGTAYTFGGANDATNSTTAGITGTFTTAGNQAGTASYTVIGEGLTGEAVNSLSVGFTADAVNNRTESATGVNLGRVLVGQTTGSQNTTVSSVTGQDSTLTRTTLGTATQHATVTNGTVTLTNGTSYTFGGANDGVNSTTAGITGNFTATGVQSGTASYTLTGEGLTGETVNPLSVAYTADAVAQRTITNGGVTNLGTFHTGATVSIAANNFTSTGANATTTSVMVAGGAGTADVNGVTLMGGTTSFTGGTATAVNGTTQTFGGTITNAAGGTTTGSFNLAVTTLENGGAGLTGETAYTSVNVAYTATVYTGQGVWITNGSGTWGTVLAPVNWSAAGGAPGLDANFTNTDSATFGSALTSGTALVMLAGDNPSLNAITFNNTNTASYIIEGTGGGSTGTLTLNGNGTAALLTDSAAGTQAINAPIVLAANGVSINVTTADTLAIGGPISGTGALATATGTGTTTLTGANTYSGATTAGAGLLIIGNGTSGSIANASVVSVSNGAKLAFDEANGSTQSNNIADAGTVQGLEGAGITNTLSGNITGAGGFTQTGTGTIVLTGTNTYGGATAVNAGGLNIGNGTSGSINAASAVTVASLATITFDEATGSTITNNITDAGSVVLNEGAGITNTFSGTISGAGGLVQTGTGTTVFTGANTYGGDTTIAAGTVVASTGSFGTTGTLHLTTGTLSDGAANVTIANNVDFLNNSSQAFAFAGTGTLTFAGGTFTTPNAGTLSLTVTNTTTIADAITGGASIVKLGAGTLNLTGNNSAYTGITAIDAGTLTVNNANALGSGPVTFANGGIFDYTGTTPASFANTFGVLGGTPAAPAFAEIENTSGHLLTIAGTVNKPDANFLFNAGTGSITVSGQITSTGAGGAFDSDMFFTNGTTTLTNANNNYTGATHIFGNGVLVDGVANAVPASSIVILGDPGLGGPFSETANSTNTYNLNGFAQTLGGLQTTSGGPFTDTNTVVGGTGNGANTTSALNIVTTGANQFNGIIGGAGANQNNISLAISGTGNEVFGGFGPNTFTGGTTISGGVTVGTGINDAFGSGPVAINGGTVVVGSGELTSGAVTLAGGTLMTSAIPGGGGLLGLPSNNHIITVNNTYTQTSGTLVFGINSAPDPATGLGANNDRLTAGGAVTITGGTLALNIAPSVVPSLMKGSTFLVISSPTAITLGAGTQATVINPKGFQITATLDPSTVMLTPPPGIVGNGDNVYLTITSTSFALNTLLSGASQDEMNIANNIDLNINSATNPQLASAITQALVGTPTAATAATIVDSFNPAKFGNFVQSNIVNNASFSMQEMTSYLAGLRSEQGDFLVSNGGLDSSGLTIAAPGMDPALAQTASHLLAWSPAPLAHGLLSDSSLPLLTGTDSKDLQPVHQSLSGHEFSTFIVGNVVVAQNFSQPGIPHADSTTGGVQLGADYRVTPHLRTGVMFGYNHSDGSLDNNGSKATIDSYAPGVYLSYADSGWYANGVANYGFNSYTEDRNVSIGALSARAHGAPTGDQVTGDIGGGYDFHIHKLTFGPLIGLQYTHLSVDSYQEDGAGALGSNLAVGSQDGESLRSRVGGHISYLFQAGTVTLTPHLDASWQHEFLSQVDGISGQFAGGATPFTVSTTNASRESVLLDGGINADISGQVTIFGDYLIQAGQSNYFGQSVQAGVKIGF